jgi:hypothetical protein
LRPAFFVAKKGLYDQVNRPRPYKNIEEVVAAQDDLIEILGSPVLSGRSESGLSPDARERAAALCLYYNFSTLSGSSEGDFSDAFTG